MAMPCPSLSLDQNDITRRLLDLQNVTGYDMMQKHGQRVYGGPPPGWTGPPPDKGTEVYCYRIPRDCFEDELVPIFSTVGKIYELRLMIEFSGTNRSYCYVRYTKQEDAREAIKKLNNYQIREGYPLAVIRSVDNRKLCIKTYPPLKEREDLVVDELGSVEGVEGVNKVLYQSRGWLEVEFITHRLAALARRQLVPGNVVLFGRVEIKNVDWADPEELSVGQDNMGRVISVRNVPSSFTHHRVGDIFNNLSDGQVANVVKNRYIVLVTFYTMEGAKLAMHKSTNIEVEGIRLELSWWSNTRRLDRGHDGPQQRSVTPPVLSIVDQLHRVCIAQGWGAPQYTLTRSRQEMTSGVMFQCGVTVPGVPGSQVTGDWCCDMEVTRNNVASKALLGIVQVSRQLPPPGQHIFPHPSWRQLHPPSVQFSSQSQGHSCQHPSFYSQYPPTNQAHNPPIISLPTPQFRPGSAFSLFPPIARPTSQFPPNIRPTSLLSSGSHSPKPLLAVPPVTRASGDGLDGRY